MRINSKTLVVSLALVVALATEASAAVRTPDGDRGIRDENPIVRLIRQIRNHFVHALDDIIVPPPCIKI